MRFGPVPGVHGPPCREGDASALRTSAGAAPTLSRCCAGSATSCRQLTLPCRAKRAFWLRPGCGAPPSPRPWQRHSVITARQCRC